jgi:fused signal recognition particle receptor
MALFKSAFKKLTGALSKTREGSAGALRTILTGKPLSKPLLRDLERAMIQADIGIKTAVELRKDIEAGWERGEIEDGDAALLFLKDQLTAYFPEEDRRLNFAGDAKDGSTSGGGPTVILVSGINGAGKTTSIAKVCKSLRDQDKSVLLAACDTFRAAAVAYDAAEAALARGVDVLILDTAGRLHTQTHLMDQLTKIRRVVEKKIPGAPHEVLLVIDATTGQNGINQAKVFAQAIDVTGIFLSKLDGSARGGIVVAIREALNLPVKFIGTGETPDDVEPFDPEAFVEAMFAEG